jgi:hypothetical protein
MHCPLHKQDDQSKFSLSLYILESVTLDDIEDIHAHSGEHSNYHLVVYDKVNMVGRYHFRGRYCLQRQGWSPSTTDEETGLCGKRTETNAPQTKSKEGYSLLYITLKEEGFD